MGFGTNYAFKYRKVKEPYTQLVRLPKPPFISSELRQLTQTKLILNFHVNCDSSTLTVQPEPVPTGAICKA